MHWKVLLGPFIHKKDWDFHRDWNTENILRLLRQAEISRFSPSGMVLVTELRMPDIKHCPCFDTLAWNDGIENTKIICSKVHTSIAIISEIFMSTLVKISRFRSRCKIRDLYPANSCKCECPYCRLCCLTALGLLYCFGWQEYDHDLKVSNQSGHMDMILFEVFWRASTWFHNNRYMYYNSTIYIIDNFIVLSDLVESSGYSSKTLSCPYAPLDEALR